MNIHSVVLTAVSRRDLPPGPKRDAILRAAIDVFAERGYFNAQVADVARAAGVAAGTVYLYFKSKDDLLVSIFERRCARRSPKGARRVAGLDDPRERLRRHRSRLHLGRLGRDRDLAIVFQVELRQSTKFMERFSVDAAARLSRPDPRGDRRRPARRAFPHRHQADARGQDVLRRARRDGDQLDPEPAPLRARAPTPTRSSTCSSTECARR